MIHVLDGQNDLILDYITLDNIVDDNHRKSLENTLETYDFIALNKLYAEHLEKRNRIIIPDEDGSLREFIIGESIKYKDSEGYKVQVFANASYLELKKANIVYPDRFTGSTSQHGGRALNDTGWQIGLVEVVGNMSINIETHTNPYEYLKRIAKEFGGELRFRIEHDGSKITARYVDILERIGEWNGREVEFGKDLDGVRRVEKQDIVTALLGLGPEDENGNRLEVLVEDEDALQRWGRIDEHGELKHLIEPYEIQSERTEITEAEARQYTRTALDKRINTKVTYEASVVDLQDVLGHANKKIWYGDTIRIKDTHFHPPLFLEARAFEMVRSIKRKAKKDIKLGDYIEFTEEEVNAIWKQLQKDIQKRVTAYEMAEYTYDKLTIDDKDETVFEDGKTFSEAVGIDAKEYAEAQDELIKADVKDYADTVSKQEADSALSSAKQYAVAKEVYDNQMQSIADDISDRAPIEYVDGKIQVVDDRLDDFDTEIEKKADGDTIYTINQVDNMINNTVSKTEYTTDMNDVVKDLSDQNTRIGQNETAIGLRAKTSELNAVENSLNNKIGNVEVKADAVEISVGEVRADLDGLEIGGRNLFRPSKITNLVFGGSPGNSTLVSGSNYKGYHIKVSEGEIYSFSRESRINNRHEYGFTVDEPERGVEVHGWVRDRSEEPLKYEGIIVPEGMNYLLLYMTNQSDDLPNIKLEKGNKATDWSPAPEDVDGAINQVSGKIETLDGEIKAVAGEVSLKANQSIVDSLENRVSDAETELIAIPGKLEIKANASDVYNKSQTFTKAEVNASFDAVNTQIELKVDDGEARTIFLQEANSFTFDAAQVNFTGHVFGKDATFEGALQAVTGTFGEVAVTDGDFNLQDGSTGTQYSATPRPNIIRDHSFELLSTGDLSSYSSSNNWINAVENDNSPWRIVGTPKLSIGFSGTTLSSLPIFGGQAMVVRNSHYVRQYIGGNIGANTTYTLSAHFRRQHNATGGIPVLQVWHVNALGNRVTRLFSETFPTVKNDYTVDIRAHTFTTPSDYYVEGDSLEIIVSGSNSNWVHVDGVQLVEGDRPSIYMPEDELWNLINGRYSSMVKTNLLWSGSLYPTGSQTITPEKSMNDCATGWILRWQGYSPGSGILNTNFEYTHIPKMHTSGSAIRVILGTSAGGTYDKYIYVTNTTIRGHDNNTADGSNNRALTGVYEY